MLRCKFQIYNALYCCVFLCFTKVNKLLHFIFPQSVHITLTRTVVENKKTNFHWFKEGYFEFYITERSVLLNSLNECYCFFNDRQLTSLMVSLILLKSCFFKSLLGLIYSRLHSNSALLLMHDPHLGPTECTSHSKMILHSGWFELENPSALEELW